LARGTRASLTITKKVPLMRAQTRANRIRLVQSHIAFQKLRSCHDKSGPIAAKNKRSVFGSNVSEDMLL